MNKHVIDCIKGSHRFRTKAANCISVDNAFTTYLVHNVRALHFALVESNDNFNVCNYCCVELKRYNTMYISQTSNLQVCDASCCQSMNELYLIIWLYYHDYIKTALVKATLATNLPTDLVNVILTQYSMWSS